MIKKIIVHPLSKRIFLILLFLTFLGILQIPKEEKKVLSEAEATTAVVAHNDFYLIIPKLEVQAPIIPDVDGGNKDLYFQALEKGVAHLSHSAKPGEGSNIFIFGHSSFYSNQPGNYKEIFRHLEDLQTDDQIIVWYQGKENIYAVKDKKIVDPQEIEVAKPTLNEQLTLMTCVPPGTTLKRLIVIALPVKE